MAAEPLAKVEVVDRGEPFGVRRELITVDPDQRCQHQVHGFCQPCRGRPLPCAARRLGAELTDGIDDRGHEWALDAGSGHQGKTQCLVDGGDQRRVDQLEELTRPHRIAAEAPR